MSRTFFSLDRGGEDFSTSSPVVVRKGLGFAFLPSSGASRFAWCPSPLSSLVATTPVGSETSKRGGCRWQPIDLSEARGLVLCWVIRGGMRDFTEASASGTDMPTGVKDTHPRTRASPEPIRPPPEKHAGDEQALPGRRSGSLRFQFFGVEVFSLLPQSQCDRCNLARQRQPGHGRLDAFGEGPLVELLEWSGLHAGPNRGSFE